MTDEADERDLRAAHSRAGAWDGPSAITNVSRIALVGAVLGAGFGLFLLYGTAFLYPLHVGGQPIYPVPMGFITTFEMTMLGLMGFAFLGLFVDSGFPSYTPKDYVPEISNGKIAVLFQCDRGDEQRLAESLTKAGAESVQAGGGAPAMSTSLSVILKRLALVARGGCYRAGRADALLLRRDQDRLAVVHGDPAVIPSRWRIRCPFRSGPIPIEGPVSIANMGAPEQSGSCG